MKLGCNTVVFGHQDLEVALKCIAWAGYDGAELAFLGKMAQHIQLRTDSTYIDNIRCLARKYHLELFAVEAAVAAKLGEPSELEKQNSKEISGLFEVTSKLGISTIAIGSGGRTGDEEKTKQVIRNISSIGEEAESWGIKIAVKPHVGASIHNTESLLRMIDEIDSPAVGINFDPSHLYRSGEDPSEAALMMEGRRIFHSHFRDCPHREHHPGLPPMDDRVQRA